MLRSLISTSILALGLVAGIVCGYFSNISTIKKVNAASKEVASRMQYGFENQQKYSLIAPVEIYAVRSENRTVEVRFTSPYDQNTILSLTLTYDEKTRIVSNNQKPAEALQLIHARGSVIFKRQGGTLYAALIQGN